MRWVGWDEGWVENDDFRKLRAGHSYYSQAWHFAFNWHKVK